MEHKLPDDVRSVLRECTFSDQYLYLPRRRLNNYKAVNKVLEILGGKWNGRLMAHVFQSDPSDAVIEAAETGVVTDVVKKFQFFPTPAALADRMVELAQLKDGQTVLEPSCGKGAIIDAIIRAGAAVDIFAWDIQEDMVHACRKRYSAGQVINILQCDFLQRETIGVDAVIMNPPFTRGQDIAHVRHAYEFPEARRPAGGHHSAVVEISTGEEVCGFPGLVRGETVARQSAERPARSRSVCRVWNRCGRTDCGNRKIGHP